MAAVPITIVGILTTGDGNSQNATMVGMASLTGLGVGGGPMPPVGIWPSPGHPAHPIAPGGPPPGLWPGGHPEHPIVLPPDKPPEVPPPSVWPNPPEGIAPTPEHPIYYPKPEPPAGTLITWKAVWTEATGWLVVGVPNVPHPVPSA